MKLIRISPIVAPFLVAVSGCAITSLSSVAVRGTVVTEPLNHHCIAGGENTVLHFSSLTHNPFVPFAYDGWALTLEFNELPRANHTYSVPSNEVHVVLWSISHHPVAPANDVSGQVVIEAVTANAIDTRLTLKSSSRPWAQAGPLQFSRSASSPAKCMAPNPAFNADPQRQGFAPAGWAG